jgi:hypothetical protein
LAQISASDAFYFAFKDAIVAHVVARPGAFAPRLAAAFSYRPVSPLMRVLHEEQNGFEELLLDLLVLCVELVVGWDESERVSSRTKKGKTRQARTALTSSLWSSGLFRSTLVSMSGTRAHR